MPFFMAELPRTSCQNQLRGKRTEGSAYRSHHFPQARQELAKEGYGKETGLISINRGWLIGREDLKCLRIHIWEAPGILGGHGRHCKLILGKGVGQRTLPLSGLSPSWVTTLSRRVGTAQLMPGCPQIKKKATFSFSDDEIAMLVHLRPRFCLPQTVGVLNWQC